MSQVDDGVSADDVGLADAGLLAEFTAAYRGPHEPRDALAWLDDPTAVGPSGATSPATVLAPLRARLYRPDVTRADRARFDRAAERVRVDAVTASAALEQVLEHRRAASRAAARGAERPEAAADGATGTGTGRGTDPPRRSRRALGTAVAGVIAVAVGGGLFALLPRPAHAPAVTRSSAAASSPVPHPSPLPSGVVGSAPLAFVGSPAQQHSDRADLAHLFSPGDTRTIGDYLFAHRTGLTGALRTDSIAVDRRGRGPGAVSLRGIDGGGGPGDVSVLLTCGIRAPYAWTLTTDTPEGDRSRIGRSSGADCGAGLITSSFVPAHLLIPTSIDITVPEGVDWVLEVDLSQY